MAGEAIVSGVVGDMVGRAISLLSGRLRDGRDGVVEDKLRRLRRVLVRVESAVDAAEARRITSRALLAWLSELVDGAHQGRYVLDAFPGEALGYLDGGGGGGHGELVRSFSLPNPFSPAKRLRVAARRLQVFGCGGGAAELDSVLANLENVSSDLKEFIMLLQWCPPALHRPLVTNIYADSMMFGRHVERRRVVDFLLQDDDDDDYGCGELEKAKLGVLLIIGRPGLGKTTLVQNVCADAAVRRRFSLIMLLDFHCMSLTAAGEAALLLRSLFTATATATAMASNSALPSDVGEKLILLERQLRGERFLTVFDNADARRRQVLDAVMPALRRGGMRGSKVIVTSADDSHVADLGTAERITLRPAPAAEYWFFFKAHAFGGADAEADPRLAAAGQAIAKKLRGSFFGGKIVGALLRSRAPDPRLWRSVAAGLPCVGNGDDYIAVAAGSVFPGHVTVRGIIVSGSPVRGLVGLQDASLTTIPPAPDDDGGGGRRRPELPVLLCKSVFPSYCLYYAAHCTIDRHGEKQ